MMRKSYYQKLACMVTLLIVLLIFQKYTGREKENFPEAKFVMASPAHTDLYNFDPNQLDRTQWLKFGFSEKQISIILKYREILGGKFTSKEQLKKCYAISVEKFNELNPYIQLPEASKELISGKARNGEKNTLSIPGKFNPDQLSVKDWLKMGFSEKQTEAILKYRNYLGGSFTSKEKFKECFIISAEHYSQLEPYLLLPAKTPESSKRGFNNTSIKIAYQPFDPNRLNAEEWQALGFSEKQARTIVNYRDKNLKGNFKTPDDLQKCFVISAEKFRELKPYIRIQEKQKQEKTDFSKADLNTITFRQLLEFGLDERSAGSIIGFRRKLGGFVNKQQILDTYNIDKEIVQKLVSTALLETSNVPKYSLADAPEEWLKNHPYFKYSADKIIFYRITYPDDKKIWKFLKLKPEYEQKMRLYVK